MSHPPQYVLLLETFGDDAPQAMAVPLADVPDELLRDLTRVFHRPGRWTAAIADLMNDGPDGALHWSPPDPPPQAVTIAHVFCVRH